MMLGNHRLRVNIEMVVCMDGAAAALAHKVASPNFFVELDP
jgi:hypothetical protein